MLILDLNPGTDEWVAMELNGNELTHLVNGHHVAVLVRGGVVRVPLGMPGGASGETELGGILLSVVTTNESPFAVEPYRDDWLHDLWVDARARAVGWELATPE